MIDFNQFKEHVVIPTLKYLDSEIPYSEEAVDPHMGARERGYQSCYKDMKEKIMDMIRAEIKYDI